MSAKLHKVLLLKFNMLKLAKVQPKVFLRDVLAGVWLKVPVQGRVLVLHYESEEETGSLIATFQQR